jgi:hypothetical protein
MEDYRCGDRTFLCNHHCFFSLGFIHIRFLPMEMSSTLHRFHSLVHEGDKLCGAVGCCVIDFYPPQIKNAQNFEILTIDEFLLTHDKKGHSLVFFVCLPNF